MPQFAVYRNPGSNGDILFVVQIMSGRLDRSLGRVVIPLVVRGERSPPDHPLTPHLVVQGQAVYADPLNLATLPATRLRSPLEILPERDQDLLCRAIDEMISRA